MCWLPETGTAELMALSHASATDAVPDLDVTVTPAVQHLIIHDNGSETVQIRTTDRCISLRLQGDRATDGPVQLIFQVRGLANIRVAATNLARLSNLRALPVRWPKRSRQQLLMRDALIAVDASAAGASYRGIAVAIIDRQRTAAEWNGPSRSLKERMRRALAKGRRLRDGGYLQLIY